MPDDTPKELRCGGTMHGKMPSPTLLEVPCKRRVCGKEPGVVVLHTFDLTTGNLVGTVRFADPSRKDNRENGTQ